MHSNGVFVKTVNFRLEYPLEHRENTSWIVYFIYELSWTSCEASKMTSTQQRLSQPIFPAIQHPQIEHLKKINWKWLCNAITSGKKRRWMSTEKTNEWIWNDKGFETSTTVPIHNKFTIGFYFFDIFESIKRMFCMDLKSKIVKFNYFLLLTYLLAYLFNS